MTGVLVANRGEIALRIMRTAAARGLPTAAVFSEDESDAPHVVAADRAVALEGSGPAAYLDVAAICAAALASGATMVHPGYGFLSESPELSDACVAAGLTFVGPDGATLRLLGNKSATRELATAHSVPVLPATTGSTSVDTARAFADAGGLSSVIVKATAGGGGRGMRIVEDLDELEQAMERCRSEAERSFGVPDVYVEAYLPRARHIEVQVVGDGVTPPMHLFDRDCTGQRRHQKMVEIAPALFLSEDTRDDLYSAALTLATAVSLRGVATFEFLVDTDRPDAWYFIEANPRIQVEHGITEQITGLDLVAIQLDLAGGKSLTDLGLSPQGLGEPRGVAIEARITGGPGRSDRLVDMKFPAGPSLRIETHLGPGMRVGTGFDPLLAKVIAFDDDFPRAATLLNDALGDVVLADLDTDISTLTWYLTSSAFLAGETTTRTIDQHLATSSSEVSTNDEVVDVSTPTGGTVVAVPVEPGTVVARGDVLAVVEAMKMESDISSPVAGVVTRIDVQVGATVTKGAAVATVDSRGHRQSDDRACEAVDLSAIREDLADITSRHRRLLDAERPAAVARRHERDKRTARENLTDLFDVDSFHEYGGLVVAAQRRRRSLSELESATPADGLVTGFGTVNGRSVASLAYDYTVLAGTQGLQSHKKAERIFELAARRGTPVVVFAEGGGGRPGDTDDMSRATRMDLGTFVALGRLNGVVPTVGIASGRCFAGNAALLGACDVVIATRDSSIGLGGPAMIEGGGLGTVDADDVGPSSVQAPNGVIDILVDDEAEATDTAKRYLSYFGDPSSEWSEADQRLLRHVVPESRKRPFDIRQVIATLADEGSVLELRSQFGPGMATALVRIEGRSVGVVANDGSQRGGTIGSDEADKMARFLQLCEAFGLPVLSLCDTAGFLVGPDAERTATVRHVSRLFVLTPSLTVPFCTVIVRKAYGLGGQAMAGGSFRVPDAIVAWPTGALGAMGPEGAVKLGFRRELDAIDDPEERERTYRGHLADFEGQGKAVNAASVFEIDDVIDPASTRTWLSAVIGAPRPPRSPGIRRIDTW
ncbi:carboxyl transferase domain-containing protein [Rhodococcoides kyotonense]|uniref:Acetyl-CoA carboxylase, carboxyltransferase component n=1 Tax=Rhodococcoides kyotonense TaxID=398843 RepID=A0A239MQY4_9NOCA|nr:carboxyl transferase domain-containing protein [Rhodococcus kyotonensis]SNT45131.1 Acetyl-CoA carboxylase, carboxyltransferase component [Rhodococcus kyotonensis]